MSTRKGKRRHHRHVHKHDWREAVNKYSSSILIVLGAVIGIVVLSVTSILAWEGYQRHLYQGVYGPEIEKELGFTIDFPRFRAGDENVEVIAIHPVPNGYMDKIGFRDGDVILSHTVTEFYKTLYTKRGETTSVDVVDGGDGLALSARKVRARKFLIPPKQQP